MISVPVSDVGCDESLAPQSGKRCAPQEAFYQRGRWYDGTGKFLGYGDLSRKDVHCIRQRMAEGDLFIVVSAMLDWLNPAETNTLESLVTKFPLIITKNGVFFVTHSVENKELETLRGGIKVHLLTPETALGTLCHTGAKNKESCVSI